MKRNGLLLWLALVFSAPLFSQNRISLEDIWTRGTFKVKPVAGFNSLSDGRYYCSFDAASNLLRYEFVSGNPVDTIVRYSDLRAANGGKDLEYGNFAFSSDEKKLLIATETESIYRHSSRSIYYVYDIARKTLVKPVSDKVMNAEFSPDASKIGFVRQNDLYYYDLIRNSEVRVTKDGKENAVINGATDWVYEEEFAIWRGFAWSPAGDKLAFYRFDESKVPQFEMAMYGSLYPEQYKFKYPKAGEANSLVGVFVYDLKSELIAEMQTGMETDIYLPRMQWTSDNSVLSIQRLNRLQNKFEILLANAGNGKSEVIYSETNPYYVDITDNVTFLKDGKTFLLTSEKDGFNHVYQFSLKGKEIRQITKGSFDVDEILGIDEKNKVIYFTSSEINAAERYVYSIGFNGKGKVKLSNDKGWNSAAFNSDFTFYMNVFSTINTPPVYTLRNKKGDLVRILEDNKALADKMKTFNLSQVQFSTLKNEVGQEMNMYIVRPVDFDSTKKYPVLMYVYGGPGSQTVKNAWTGANYFWFQMLAQHGYIVVSVDGRGTGFKGQEFKKCTYLKLGNFEIADQIFAARQIASWPFVDAGRIGIWGWSFGGYMAGLGISKGNAVFKTAISVAPVTNWRYYDNIYTERFMRTPQENGTNYDENSPISHVSEIKGNYLIIHGTADDNVHFQNTVEMVDRMIQSGIKFDSEFYPNKNHGIGGQKTRLHLYERMTRFLIEKL